MPNSTLTGFRNQTLGGGQTDLVFDTDAIAAEGYEFDVTIKCGHVPLKLGTYDNLHEFLNARGYVTEPNEVVSFKCKSRMILYACRAEVAGMNDPAGFLTARVVATPPEVE